MSVRCLQKCPSAAHVLLLGALLAAVALCPIRASAQTPTPSAPASGSGVSTGGDAKGDGTKSSAQPAPNDETDDPGKNRVFGMLPNYATVEGHDAAPLSTKRMFTIAALNTFDPYVFIFDGITAGIIQAQNTPPSWGRTWSGYGKRYALAVSDNTIGNFMTSAVMPAMLRQDPRYYVKGEGSGWRRTGYALSRVAITRGRSGGQQVNLSEFVGNGIGTALSTQYHPADDRSPSAILTRYATQIMWDAVTNELKEFWPDIRRKLKGR